MPPATPKGLPYSLISSGPVGGVLLGNHFTPQTFGLLYTCEMIIWQVDNIQEVSLSHPITFHNSDLIILHES